MKEKNKSAVSIIGGADGPTSVYIASRSGKRPLKIRIRNYIHRFKRKKAEKRIFANAHTIEEVVEYAYSKYSAIEISTIQRKYAEQRNCLKESLLVKHKPELLGDMMAKIPDHEMPMDFHIYEVRNDKGWLEIEVDYIWNIFEVSYGGNKKEMQHLKKIAQDLYIYYGVTEEDIRIKSEKYSSLLSALS